MNCLIDFETRGIIEKGVNYSKLWTCTKYAKRKWDERVAPADNCEIQSIFFVRRKSQRFTFDLRRINTFRLISTELNDLLYYIVFLLLIRFLTLHQGGTCRELYIYIAQSSSNSYRKERKRKEEIELLIASRKTRRVKENQRGPVAMLD